MSIAGRTPLTAPRRKLEDKKVWVVSFLSPGGVESKVTVEGEPSFSEGFCSFRKDGEIHRVSGTVHVYPTTIRV